MRLRHNTKSTLFITLKAGGQTQVPVPSLVTTSKEPVCPRVELILKIIIILLIIFLGFIKSKPC